MAYQSIDEWLSWQTTLHAREIELGLDRIRTVAERLGLLNSPFKVITVAGTNGKGSSVAMFSTILHHAGYKVGTYTSPHIIHYNERVRIGLRCANDDELCAAFARIDKAREDISLSFFEFATLAALDIFHQHKINVAVLEVGLGGRLDATNIIDSDLAMVTSIGLDHMEYLGDNRESIGFEKAGVFRKDKPAICGDSNPPASVKDSARRIGSTLYQINQDYFYNVAQSSWSFKTGDYELQALPLPNLSGGVQIQNAANVLMGLHCIRDQLPVNYEAIETGLREVTLEGRFQRIVKHCEIILDVAHNRESAQTLADNLMALPKPNKTIAVFAVLNDKDVTGITELLRPHVDNWYVSVVQSMRGMEYQQVEHAIKEHDSTAKIEQFPSIQTAYSQAQNDAQEGDRILVFGSIFTVSEVLASES